MTDFTDGLFGLGIAVICLSAISIGAWSAMVEKNDPKAAARSGARAMSWAWHGVALCVLAAAVRFWPW